MSVIIGSLLSYKYTSTVSSINSYVRDIIITYI